MILLVLAQSADLSPLPAAVRPAIAVYGNCLVNYLEARKAEWADNATEIYEQAKLNCRGVRNRSVTIADTALAADRNFSDPDARRTYISTRIETVEKLVREGLESEFEAGK